MTPIIRKFVLKLLSKDRGSGITSLPGAQHRMIQESIITDTLLKRGVNPETITSEGMLQSILNGIKKEKDMIARSKAEAQKNLATVMDMKGRKIRPGAKIMGGEEVVETEAEIAKRLNKGNKEGIERIKEKQLIESFDPDEMATGGRAGFTGGGIAKKLIQQIIKKYKGKIDDKLLNQMLADDNPQRLAEVMATVDEALIMQGKGMGPDEIIATTKESWKRKKQATGGRAGFSEGGWEAEWDEIYEDYKLKQIKLGKEFVSKEEFIDMHRDNNAQGGRAGFAGGGMGRRAFLKMMAALGATGVAAKSGLVSLLGKSGGKQVAKELTQVPIKQINEMPTWFKPLVNRVIKEGDDVTKELGTIERQVVHKTKLPDSQTDVIITQDLNTGDVVADIGTGKHGFADGKFGQPVRLEYKASEVIEPDLKTGKGGGKTKEEFTVEEAEFTGGHPENVKFEESTFEKFGDHESNFDEVEAFAKGKSKKDARKVSESFDKQNEDIADYFSNMPGPDDYASGGIARMLGE